jgi:hypothetical protein
MPANITIYFRKSIETGKKAGVRGGGGVAVVLVVVVVKDVNLRMPGVRYNQSV